VHHITGDRHYLRYHRFLMLLRFLISDPSHGKATKGLQLRAIKIIDAPALEIIDGSAAA